MLLADELRGAKEKAGALGDRCAAPGGEGLLSRVDGVVGQRGGSAEVHADGLGRSRGIDGSEGLTLPDMVPADNQVIAPVELRVDAVKRGAHCPLILGRGEVRKRLVLEGWQVCEVHGARPFRKVCAP